MNSKDKNLIEAQNNKLKEENAHLRSLLKQKLSEARPLSDEESICVIQIKLLREMACSRELSLEEVKKLDILNKNLRLIRGTVIVQEKENRTVNMSNDNLIDILVEDE